MGVEMKNLVNRNKALMFIVWKDYVSAVREYQECIDRDATDVVAINNKGLCLMYLRDLADGIKVLEKALESVPTAALNETFVVNLYSMYELAYDNQRILRRRLVIGLLVWLLMTLIVRVLKFEVLKLFYELVIQILQNNFFYM